MTTLGIALPTDYAVQNEARGDFIGLGIDEQIHPKEWFHPDGTKMALVSGCANFNGGETETREFSIEAFNLATMERLTEKHSKTFPSLESGQPFRQWVYVYELAENGEEPEPDPPPSDGGYVEELEYMGHRILTITAYLKLADRLAEDLKDGSRELADLL